MFPYGLVLDVTLDAMLNAGELGRSVYRYCEEPGGERDPAARRAWMAAISSGENPAVAREVVHDGGRPVYPSSTWSMCYKNIVISFSSHVHTQGLKVDNES